MTWPEAFAVVGIGWAFVFVMRALASMAGPAAPRPRLSGVHPGSGQFVHKTTKRTMRPAFPPNVGVTRGGKLVCLTNGADSCTCEACRP